MSYSSSNFRRTPGRSASRSSPFLTPFALPVQPVLDVLSLTPESQVLALGEVSCRFMLPIARYIATKKGTGTVYTCDFTEEGVLQTYQKAKDAHLIHLVVPLHWEAAKSRRLPLEDEEVDVIIAISTAVFQSLPGRFVEESLRVLRNGGKLFIAEWLDTRKALLRAGNHPRVTKEAALEILTGTSGAVCTSLDIPELEWAVMLTKSPLATSLSYNQRR